ncbi:hypothetical protein HYZ64_03175 [Candidatus Berkelbacteria bacterium]|nr:hypothetical protein [Candidatus Berkelbacteria bacterium]
MKPTKQVSYLRHLTTKLGLVQHAKGSTPDLRSGLTLDDNASAVIASVLLADTFGYNLEKLVRPYFNFVARAQQADGWFINFFDSQGEPLEDRGSEDCFGRTIWALSIMAANTHDKPLAGRARQILSRALPHVGKLTATRALANVLVGAASRRDSKQTRAIANILAKRINLKRRPQWVWFEDTLTYENGLVPYALSEAAQLLKDRTLLSLSREVFEFLDSVSRRSGTPSPIGNQGWYRRGKRRAAYDQQPIDAAAMALAAASLYRTTRDPAYRTKALDWWSWFHGKNIKERSLVNPRTGGIYDGINRDRLNRNQGAENIAVYLIMYSQLRQTIQT